MCWAIWSSLRFCFASSAYSHSSRFAACSKAASFAAFRAAYARSSVCCGVVMVGLSVKIQRLICGGGAAQALDKLLSLFAPAANVPAAFAVR